jgi:1-phosphofructokinase family hexose kinase
MSFPVKVSGKIITVGLSPAWDITCRGRGLGWGLHKDIDEQTIKPAGKALNISRALAWMGQKSVAAGLWGRDDYNQMLEYMRPLRGFVKIKRTAVDGRTRRNVTVVDTAKAREMHLRDKSRLASVKALRKLKADLKQIVRRGSICVFAGAMPADALLDEVVKITEVCRSLGAKIVLDTYGGALKRVVEAGLAWFINPNVEELRGLVGVRVGNDPVSLAEAGRRLLWRVEAVLISRGEEGGVLVTRQGAWQGRCAGRAKVVSTVGCGDYLLAGFLKGLRDGSGPGAALETAIRVATAHARGWTESKTWPEVRRAVRVKVEEI